jgi:DNA-binding MarR family transcriptional regulator
MQTIAGRRSTSRLRNKSLAKSIDLGPLAGRIGFIMRRAQLLIARELNSLLHPTGVNAGQFTVLTLVAHNPGLKQTEISNALWIKRSNLVTQLHELERRGLVRRMPSPTDRRSHALHLTPRGGKLLRRVQSLAEEHDHRLTALLGRQRKEDLTELLVQITTRLRSSGSLLP